MTKFEVQAKWDAEADVWTAYSDDIAGLVTEAATWDALKEKLGTIAAELIALNDVKMDKDGGEIHIVTDERVSIAA